MGVIAEGIPRGCQGLFTPVSLRYPLSVFNKKLHSQRKKVTIQQVLGYDKQILGSFVSFFVSLGVKTRFMSKRTPYRSALLFDMS